MTLKVYTRKDILINRIHDLVTKSLESVLCVACFNISIGEEPWGCS